jgi:beta-glucuronidase
MKKAYILITICLFTCLFEAYSQKISLNGEWSFAIDPLGKGVENDWHEDIPSSPNGLVRGWGIVTVPHTYTLDSRYNITGIAWYRRSFNLPENIGDRVCRIRFSAVFYKARIWINGTYIGRHEGGYTPFMFDLTLVVKPGKNSISVEVDNRWDDYTVPGARIGTAVNLQVYPWYEYGGITEPVSLLVTDKAFITKQKIEPDIDLKKNTAVVNIKTWANLYTKTSQKMSIEGFIAYSDSPSAPLVRFSPLIIDASPYSENLIQQKINLSSNLVSLWDPDNPFLYTFTTIIKSGNYTDTIQTRTGLRKIEASHGNLLLNGQPVRMGGVNRHHDYPRSGSLEPQKAVETDFRLIKSGNMLLSRISHYPSNDTELDWADENGLLIIEEIPSWQNDDVQLADPLFQALLILQSKEMIERDWNRPSVIGWSCGNEYSSWTPEADAYTKIMTDFFRSIDQGRFATFITHMPATLPKNMPVPHNSLRYSDIICINYYIEKGLEEHLERLHNNFPEKPILITEFGSMSYIPDKEEARIKTFMLYINTMRKYPYIVNLSWWTFNDYISRYPGTGTTGFRTFGMVNMDRSKRDLYNTVQREFSPLIIDKNPTSIKITSRTDFPSYIVKGYCVKLKSNSEVIKEWPLPVLKPGMTYTVDLTGLNTNGNIIEITNPKGFVINELK